MRSHTMRHVDWIGRSALAGTAVNMVLLVWLMIVIGRFERTTKERVEFVELQMHLMAKRTHTRMQECPYTRDSSHGHESA